MPLIPTVIPEQKDKVPDSLGTPGLQHPKNPEQIKEFSEVRDVDAKDLNAKLQAQDQAKSSSTPGIHIPENAKDINAFSEVRNEDPKALNAKLQK